MYTWNLYDPTNQCHPSKSNLKNKNKMSQKEKEKGLEKALEKNRIWRQEYSSDGGKQSRYSEEPALAEADVCRGAY